MAASANAARARCAADRERRLGGTHLEADRPSPPAAARRRARAGLGGGRRHRSARGRSLEGGQLVVGRVDRGGLVGRLDRGRSGRGRVVGREPVAAPRRRAIGGRPRDGRVVARPLVRQQVARIARPIARGAEPASCADLGTGGDVALDHEPVLERLRDGRPAGPRRARRRRDAGRSPSAAPAGGDPSSNAAAMSASSLAVERPLRRREEAQRRGGTPATGGRAARSRGRRASRSATRSASSREPPAAPRPRAGCRAERSATSRSRLADGRSPSIPSIRSASSSRSSGGSVEPRSGGRGALARSRPGRVERVILVQRRRAGTSR